MAFMDDPSFILSHIQHSCVTADDSTMCELVYVDNDSVFVSGGTEYLGYQEHSTTRTSADINSASSNNTTTSTTTTTTTSTSDSYDIESSLDISMRMRSNTAARLDEIRKKRVSDSKCRTISWKDPVKNDNIGDLFPRKIVPQGNTKKKSLLSEQMLNCSIQATIPFSEYAKYDVRSSLGLPCKKIDIYLTMLIGEDRNYPMSVAVQASAKVVDLIGLICWQYTSEGREPGLRGGVDNYLIHIAEDDGEVDTDFPALDNRESISKFGFQTLALVQKQITQTTTQKTQNYVVKINVPNGGFSTISVANEDVTMKEILNIALRKRRIRTNNRGPCYILERANERGVHVDLSAPMSSMGGVREFWIHRENSKRQDSFRTSQPTPPICDFSQYKSYRLTTLKLWSSTEIQLGITPMRIEIDPVVQSRPAVRLRSKQKPVSYDISVIAACELLDSKNSGRSTLKLVYMSSSHNEFKHHLLEGATDTVRRVVSDIEQMLELQSSQVRIQYLMKEKERQQ